jgi:adenosylmethionine-8-amino-7-oxononanoate aminotransferase
MGNGRSRHAELQDNARRHLLQHFARNGTYGPDAGELLVLDRGEGCHVFDTRGRRYIDALSSLFCCQIGYSHGEEMAAAGAQQINRLAFNTNWSTAHPPAIDLATELAARAPEGIEHVFFTCGGSESVETAWKLVRQFHLANGEPQRTKAVAREVAYHGVTLGALSFTGVRRFREPFGPPAVPTRHVPNTLSVRDDGLEGAAATERLLGEMEKAILDEGPETVAMIIAEPVQNAGGCLVPPDGYWPGLRELADRYGIVLVADEVITGFGRLGTLFGSEAVGAQPDVITCAKGLTSAYAPMGAVLAHERVAAPLFVDKATLLHGVTFGGHPLSAAMAMVNLQIFDREAVLANVQALAPHLERRLQGLLPIPIVREVRGMGFFWAVELAKDGGELAFDADERERLLRGFMPPALLDGGIIARADDRGDAVVQIAPPLVADAALLDEIVDALHAVLTRASEHMGAAAAAAT